MTCDDGDISAGFFVSFQSCVGFLPSLSQLYVGILNPRELKTQVNLGSKKINGFIL